MLIVLTSVLNLVSEIAMDQLASDADALMSGNVRIIRILRVTRVIRVVRVVKIVRFIRALRLWGLSRCRFFVESQISLDLIHSDPLVPFKKPSKMAT